MESEWHVESRCEDAESGQIDRDRETTMMFEKSRMGLRNTTQPSLHTQRPQTSAQKQGYYAILGILDGHKRAREDMEDGRVQGTEHPAPIAAPRAACVSLTLHACLLLRAYEKNMPKHAKERHAPVRLAKSLALAFGSAF